MFYDVFKNGVLAYTFVHESDLYTYKGLDSRVISESSFGSRSDLGDLCKEFSKDIKKLRANYSYILIGSDEDGEAFVKYSGGLGFETICDVSEVSLSRFISTVFDKIVSYGVPIHSILIILDRVPSSVSFRRFSNGEYDVIVQ